PQLAAEFITFENFRRYGIGPAQHLAGGIQVPRGNSLTDASAADDLPPKADGGQAVDLETDFSPDVPQEFDIPGPLMAKGKVISDTDAVNLAKPGGEIANE